MTTSNTPLSTRVLNERLDQYRLGTSLSLTSALDKSTGRNGNVTLKIFSSLATMEVIQMTTSIAAINEIFAN